MAGQASEGGGEGGEEQRVGGETRHNETKVPIKKKKWKEARRE